jgi:hypothetical protein
MPRFGICRVSARAVASPVRSVAGDHRRDVELTFPTDSVCWSSLDGPLPPLQVADTAAEVEDASCQRIGIGYARRHARSSYCISTLVQCGDAGVKSLRRGAGRPRAPTFDLLVQLKVDGRSLIVVPIRLATLPASGMTRLSESRRLSIVDPIVSWTVEGGKSGRTRCGPGLTP